MNVMKPLFLLAAIAAMILALPGNLVAQDYDKGPELDQSKDYYAVIYTPKGEIALKLFAPKAPVTVRNFVNLAEGTAEFKDPKTGAQVKRPYYNGVQFHRVIPSFMIQTGDPTATGSGGPGYQFKDEFDPELRFDRPGMLAMANSGPGTNGSQFFITEAPTPHLNNRHTIFGEIIQGSGGLDVVKEIARVDRDPNDKPRRPIRMERVAIYRLDKDLQPAAALEQIKQKEAAGGAAGGQGEAGQDS